MFSTGMLCEHTRRLRRDCLRTLRLVSVAESHSHPTLCHSTISSLSGDPEPARLDPGCLATAGALFFSRLMDSHLKSPGPWERFEPAFFTRVSPRGQPDTAASLPGGGKLTSGVGSSEISRIPGATLSPPAHPQSRIQEEFARPQQVCFGAADSWSPW